MSRQLGTLIQDALSSVGVTTARVEHWLGKPCGGCERRKQKLDQLSAWARRVASGKTEKAKDYLQKIIRYR